MEADDPADFRSALEKEIQRVQITYPCIEGVEVEASDDAKIIGTMGEHQALHGPLFDEGTYDRHRLGSFPHAGIQFVRPTRIY